MNINASNNLQKPDGKFKGGKNKLNKKQRKTQKSKKEKEKQVAYVQRMKAETLAHKEKLQ